MTSTITARCFRCLKSETIDRVPPYDFKIEFANLKSKGWFRRKFGPGADPWFCSKKCAYYSEKAIYAEKWHKENKGIIKTPFYKNIIFISTLIIIIFIIGFYINCYIK